MFAYFSKFAFEIPLYVFLLELYSFSSCFWLLIIYRSYYFDHVYVCDSAALGALTLVHGQLAAISGSFSPRQAEILYL